MLETKQLCHICRPVQAAGLFYCIPRSINVCIFVVIHIFKIVIQLTLLNIALSFTERNYFLFLSLAFIYSRGFPLVFRRFFRDRGSVQ